MTRSRAKECGTPDALTLYLREIEGGPLLSAIEERELAWAIARGDRDARARMIRANLLLVVKIARDYRGRGMVLDDLIGEGNLGLIRAAEEFDPRFGTRFCTYASYWIKEAIHHALIYTTATIRLPKHLVDLMTRWRRAERALARDLGRAPTPDQIAIHLGLTDAQWVLVGMARRATQLRLESGSGEPGCDRLHNDTSGADGAPDAMLEADDERQSLLRRMRRLDERERSILALRFGLGGGLPLTLKEAGRRLGVSREWARKIEIRAVRKLDDGASPEGAEVACGESEQDRDPPAGRRSPRRRRRRSQEN